MTPTPEQVEQARREWAEVEVTCEPVVISPDRIKEAFIAAGIGPKEAERIKYDTSFVAVVQRVVPEAAGAGDDETVIDDGTGLPHGW